MPKKKIYFENLDGLRFLCFLSVFFFHSFHTDFEYIKNDSLYIFIKRDVFGNGSLGVNFFFVLSGFLITFLLIEEKKLNGQINLKKFWIRRILRIWPLFFACVLFGFYVFPVLKSAFGQTPNEVASMEYYLVFLNNFDVLFHGLPDASTLAVLWSIAVEEQFYLVWPIILFFLPVKRYWVAFSIIIIGSLVFRAFYDSTPYHEIHTLSCIGDMAIGGFGAWAISFRKNFKERVENLSRFKISLIYSFMVGIFLFRDELLLQNYYIRIVERAIISIVILFIILEQNYASNSFFKFSRLKLITHLGRITYGLYCLHFVGILIAVNLTKLIGFNTELWQVLILETLLALGITILISSMSYQYFEKPFLRFKDRFAYIIK